MVNKNTQVICCEHSKTEKKSNFLRTYIVAKQLDTSVLILQGKQTIM